MNDYRVNRPRRDSLEDLRSANRFPDFLFVAWGIIELLANDSILRVYGLSSQDPKSEPLIDLNMDKKLRLFLKLHLLTKDEHKKVQEFKQRRNDLFHAHGIFVSNIDSSEKEKIMDLGMHAADSMHNLAERIHS